MTRSQEVLLGVQTQQNWRITSTTVISSTVKKKPHLEKTKRGNGEKNRASLLDKYDKDAVAVRMKTGIQHVDKALQKDMEKELAKLESPKYIVSCNQYRK